MLKALCSLLILAIFFAFPSDSLAQSRQKAPAQQTPKTEQGTNADQRGTPNEPLTVNVIPTAEQKAIAEKDAAEAKTKASSDALSLEYARDQVIVGIVQFGVFVLQLFAFAMQAWYMRRTVREMRVGTRATIKTALATQRSVNAMKDVSASQLEHSHRIERAYISGGCSRTTEFKAMSANQTPITGPGNKFQLTVNNHGKTPGEILEYGIGWCEADNIPAEPIYEWFPFREKLGPGTQSRPIANPIPIPNAFKRPAIYGRFRYRDIFGGLHSDGFIQEGNTPLLAGQPFTLSDPAWDLPPTRWESLVARSVATMSGGASVGAKS